MSTSLLYHGFGIKGYQYVNSHYEDGAITFTIRQSPFDFRCSSCGSARVVCKGKVIRTCLLADRDFELCPSGESQCGL